MLEVWSLIDVLELAIEVVEQFLASTATVEVNTWVKWILLITVAVDRYAVIVALELGDVELGPRITSVTSVGQASLVWVLRAIIPKDSSVPGDLCKLDYSH